MSKMSEKEKDRYIDEINKTRNIKSQSNLDKLREKYIYQLETRCTMRRTICEVLREMWDISEVLPEDLREELQERIIKSYTMAKSMNKKLRQYKHEWDSDFWEVNKDYASDLKRRYKKKREKYGETNKK